MTIRDTILAAVLAAVLAPIAPALAGQEYELPDSLARVGLPSDPNEFVRQVAAGDQLMIGMLFVAGCPSDGGWAGAAFAAMKAAAETDAHMQRELAFKLGSELQKARDLEHGRVNLTIGGTPTPNPPQCPSELPRYEAWLAEQLRREWERGLLAGVPARVPAHPPGTGPRDSVTVLGPGRSTVVGTLLRAVVSGTEASTRELVRDIARDPEVWEPWREDAARRLRFLHFGMGDRNPPRMDSPEWEQYVDAAKAALFDLAAGAPLPGHEREGLGIVATRIWIPSMMPYRAPLKRDDAFEREYERVLRAAGREPFWK